MPLKVEKSHIDPYDTDFCWECLYGLDVYDDCYVIVDADGVEVEGPYCSKGCAEKRIGKLSNSERGEK